MTDPTSLMNQTQRTEGPDQRGMEPSDSKALGSDTKHSHPPWWRVTLSWLGIALAVVAVPVGLMTSWIGAYLGNCKLGLFGDYGPLAGAQRFEFSDVLGPLVGVLLAVVPWAIIWRWGRPAWMRKVAMGVICFVTGVVTLFLYFPQILDSTNFVNSIC